MLCCIVNTAKRSWAVCFPIPSLGAGSSSCHHSDNLVITLITSNISDWINELGITPHHHLKQDSVEFLLNQRMNSFQHSLILMVITVIISCQLTIALSEFKISEFFKSYYIYICLQNVMLYHYTWQLVGFPHAQHLAILTEVVSLLFQTSLWVFFRFSMW